MTLPLNFVELEQIRKKCDDTTTKNTAIRRRCHGISERGQEDTAEPTGDVPGVSGHHEEPSGR